MRLHWARTGHDSADLHLSLMLWVSAGLRDPGLLSLGGLWLHILRYSPYGGFVDFAPSCVPPRWRDLWLLPFSAGAPWHWQRCGTRWSWRHTTNLLCERVTYPPLPSHTTVVVPLLLWCMCRPTSSES